jgi:hypothetical protein
MATLGIKQCRYCKRDIVYSASANRGAWYAKGGRICDVASEEFEGTIAHSPSN